MLKIYTEINYLITCTRKLTHKDLCTNTIYVYKYMYAVFSLDRIFCIYSFHLFNFSDWLLLTSEDVQRCCDASDEYIRDIMDERSKLINRFQIMINLVDEHASRVVSVLNIFIATKGLKFEALFSFLTNGSI